jgi:hypothetical protein
LTDCGEPGLQTIIAWPVLTHDACIEERIKIFFVLLPVLLSTSLFLPEAETFPESQQQSDSQQQRQEKTSQERAAYLDGLFDGWLSLRFTARESKGNFERNYTLFVIYYLMECKRLEKLNFGDMEAIVRAQLLRRRDYVPATAAMEGLTVLCEKYRAEALEKWKAPDGP